MSVTAKALGSKYELVSLIGTGAMGEVWRALDRVSGEQVAAKVLRSEYARDPEIIGRFVQERSILMGLSHPNIVRVHDLVVEGDALAIVMDLVEGEDLRGALKRSGPLTPALAAGVVACVLDALAAAHSQGALHRDVKPDNVLLAADWADLAPGSVQLSDFSIARLAQDSTVQATGLLGTPEYMPPELFSHGTTSAASDVYAAGVVLYELLAGRSPYAGPGNAFSIGNRAVTMMPPPVPVPQPLWQVVAAMLAKDPRRRPRAADAAETLRGLVPALAETAALAPQPDPTSWQPSGEGALAEGPIHTGSVGAALDVGSTNLDVSFTPESMKAVTQGDVSALAPRPESGLEAGVTNVGAAPAYAAPTLAPAVDEAPPAGPRSRLRALLIVGGSAVAVALVIGLVLHLTGGKGSAKGGSDAASGPVSAQGDPTKVPGSGLTVQPSATYDPDKKQIDYKLSYSADRVALQGPFLAVLPELSSGECPLPAWDGADASLNNTMSTAITASCAYSLSVPTVQPAAPVVVTSTVGVTLKGDDLDSALSTWLQSASQATDKALQSASRTNSAYAAQRLQGVEVSVPPLVSVTSGEIRVVLKPEWPSGTDPVHLLFDSEAGGETDLLRQVAGGLSDLALTDTCNGAVVVKDRTVTVLHQTDSCTILASVGDLANVSSSAFPITGSDS